MRAVLEMKSVGLRDSPLPAQPEFSSGREPWGGRMARHRLLAVVLLVFLRSSLLPAGSRRRTHVRIFLADHHTRSWFSDSYRGISAVEGDGGTT